MSTLIILLIQVIFLSFTKGNIPSFLYSTNASDVTIQNNDCPPLKPILNGNIEIKNLNMLPTTAIITCHKNYSLIGKNIIYCDDGVWSFHYEESPSKCVKRCPPPPYLEHGKLKLEKVFEDVYSPTGGYLKGTIAKYTCVEGYILEPPSSSARVCEKGYWTGSDAFCKPTVEISCSSPPKIEGGYIIQPSWPLDYSIISVGQEVVYQCGLGYKLVGSARIKCTDEGIWEPKIPSCHKETGNPFADYSAPAPSATSVTNGVPDFFSGQPTANQAANNQNMWGNNVAQANAFQAPTQPSSQPFNDLTGFFNTNEPSVFDPLAPTDQRQPPAVPSQPSMPPQRPPQPSKILTGDLESSLNSLVENLTMDSGSGKWNSPKNQPKTSAAGGWQPQPMAATTAASYRPMMGAQQAQMMGQQPMMQPMMGAPMQYPMGVVQQQPQMMGSPKIGASGAQPQQQAAFDPFGAL